MPAPGSARRRSSLQCSVAVVTYRVESPGPPNAQHVVCSAGTAEHPAQLAVRCVATDAAAAVDRDPEVSRRVHRQAVGRAILLGKRDENPAVGDRAPLAVERERADRARAAVDEVHRGAVRAPAEPVRDRQAVEDPRDPAVPVEAVERAAALAVVVGQAAGPEPALRVAGGVVQPGSGRRDLGDGAPAPVRAQVDDVAPGGQQPAVVAVDRGDRADGSGDRVRRDRDQVAVRGDPVAMDTPGEDVHPQELIAPGVPAGALAERGLLRRAGDGCAGHPWPSVRALGHHRNGNGAGALGGVRPRRGRCGTVRQPAAGPSGRRRPSRRPS